MATRSGPLPGCPLSQTFLSTYSSGHSARRSPDLDCSAGLEVLSLLSGGSVIVAWETHTLAPGTLPVPEVESAQCLSNPEPCSGRTCHGQTGVPSGFR